MPIYKITVYYEDAKKESKTIELSSPFTRWFDADGFFVAKPFQQWLASEIPLIGRVDPQNKLEASKTTPDTQETPKSAKSTGQQIHDIPDQSVSARSTPGKAKLRKANKTPNR